MNAKEKAKELIEKFKDKVNPYIGSGMLSNTHDDSAILWQSKKCALIAVDEILNSRPLDPNYVDWDDCEATHQYWYEAQKEEALEFWNDVKSELQSL